MSSLQCIVVGEGCKVIVRAVVAFELMIWQVYQSRQLTIEIIRMEQRLLVDENFDNLCKIQKCFAFCTVMLSTY